nr:hypothetical protein CFP56_31808 [Quercus suber]
MKEVKLHHGRVWLERAKLHDTEIRRLKMIHDAHLQTPSGSAKTSGDAKASILQSSMESSGRVQTYERTEEVHHLVIPARIRSLLCEDDGPIACSLPPQQIDRDGLRSTTWPSSHSPVPVSPDEPYSDHAIQCMPQENLHIKDHKLGSGTCDSNDGRPHALHEQGPPPPPVLDRICTTGPRLAWLGHSEARKPINYFRKDPVILSATSIHTRQALVLRGTAEVDHRDRDDSTFSLSEHVSSLSLRPPSGSESDVHEPSWHNPTCTFHTTGRWVFLGKICAKDRWCSWSWPGDRLKVTYTNLVGTILRVLSTLREGGFFLVRSVLRIDGVHGRGQATDLDQPICISVGSDLRSKDDRDRSPFWRNEINSISSAGCGRTIPAPSIAACVPDLLTVAPFIRANTSGSGNNRPGTQWLRHIFAFEERLETSVSHLPSSTCCYLLSCTESSQTKVPYVDDLNDKTIGPDHFGGSNSSSIIIRLQHSHPEDSTCSGVHSIPTSKYNSRSDLQRRV